MFALHVGPARASHRIAEATLYGPSNARVLAAVQASAWPQQENNWCGVATVAAIAQFRGHAVSQQDVANYLNSAAAVSGWGTAPPSPTTFGPGFKAEISGDVGTDPRSLAVGLSAEGQGKYHELIDVAGNYDATLHLVDDLIRAQEPISVIVFHGLHSVLVSGVMATDNPVTDPGSITGLEVWDPGYGIPNGNIQGAQEVLVPLSTWLNNTYYWATPYNANYFGSIADDPDPAVGPYTFNPSLADFLHLWIGHYVYLRPDAATDPSFNVKPDWPFNQGDAAIEGQHGELPAGYTGPVTSIPGTETLSDTSIDGPAFWSESAYHPLAGAFAPVTVLAWTGTDGAGHLNIETSNDGMTYSNKVVLNAESIARPSVVVVPTATTNVVVIAWTGTDTNHHLHVMYNAYGTQQTVTLTATSSYAPSLAYFGGQLWIAWAGTDSNHTLNVQALGPQGITPGAITTLSGDITNASPSLAPDINDGQLLLSWQMRGSSDLTFAKSVNGVGWTTEATLSPNLTSPLAPYMMVVNPPPAGMRTYYWIWTNWAQSVVLNQAYTEGNWPTSAFILPETSIGSPSIGYVGQKHQVLVVWTGTDRNHHINVATVPV
jgi:hypothetical protein